jgi:hypothetical protein
MTQKTVAERKDELYATRLQFSIFLMNNPRR